LIEPSNGNRMIVRSRREGCRSQESGQELVGAADDTAQMYHSRSTNGVPYYVYATAGRAPRRGPSNSRTGGDIREGCGRGGGGEEGGRGPTRGFEHRVVLSRQDSAAVGGIRTRYTCEPEMARSTKYWPQATNRVSAAAVKDRFGGVPADDLAVRQQNTV